MHISILSSAREISKAPSLKKSVHKKCNLSKRKFHFGEKLFIWLIFLHPEKQPEEAPVFAPAFAPVFASVFAPVFA